MKVDYKRDLIELITNNFDDMKQRKLQEEQDLCKKSLMGEIEIAIFGTGHIGKAMYNILKGKGYKIYCFCDNDTSKHNIKILDDVVCISPERLKNLKNPFVIIALQDVECVFSQLTAIGISNVLKHVWEYYYEGYNIFNLNKEVVIRGISQVYDIISDDLTKKIIHRKITGLFMLKEQLKNFTYEDLCENDMYCPKDIVMFHDNETIVDCGAFDGDTLDYFINDVGITNFNKYICFELNRTNYTNLKTRINEMAPNLGQRVVAYNYGVSNEEKEIRYIEDTNMTNAFKEGQSGGHLVKIDAILSDEAISYIKMDIEGSEVAAIKGAKEVIQRNKPKLAICVYHKVSDLWEIPLLIHAIEPKYNLYMRKHSLCQNETVLYAI